MGKGERGRGRRFLMEVQFLTSRSPSIQSTSIRLRVLKHTRQHRARVWRSWVLVLQGIKHRRKGVWRSRVWNLQGIEQYSERVLQERRSLCSSRRRANRLSSAAAAVAAAAHSMTAVKEL